LRHVVWVGWICKDYVSFHLFPRLDDEKRLRELLCVLQKRQNSK
jgi:hypothetical protein